MNHAMEIALQIEDLRCGYDSGDVLKGVSISVRGGEIVGLAGRNGAGKTTLLGAILGKIKPSAGLVRVCGAIASSLSSRELARKVALAPQLLDVPFSFTVAEFVAMGRLPHVGRLSSPGAADLEAVNRAVRRTDLSGLLTRTLDTLSGGERQRAVIAQALAQETDLLLLDEPAAHLDIAHQVEIFEILGEVASSGAAVLAVLHDLNMAAEYCGRIVMLCDGKVLADGPPSQVMDPSAIEKAFGIRLAVERSSDGSAPYLRYRRDGRH